LSIHSVSPPLPPAEASSRQPPVAPQVVQTNGLGWLEAGAAAPPRPGGRDARATSSPVSRSRRFRQSRALHVLAPVALGLVLLAAWQFLVQSGLVSEFLLPAPADVLRAFWASLTQDALLSYTQVTLIESLAGCALGALVALPLGYAIMRSRLAASAVQPYLAASQAMPAIALAPLIALWLGYGLPPVIALCALIVFFPMMITTVLGLRMLDRDVLDAARVEGANRWALLRFIEFPLALPSILAGIRTSLTLSITGAVVGEFVVGGAGLGELLIVQRSDADSAGVFSTLLMLALLAAALYGLARLLERRFSYMEGL
jgi:NitT/TauT family transport system permease protein